MICFLFIYFLGYMILYIATWANLQSFAKTYYLRNDVMKYTTTNFLPLFVFCPQKLQINDHEIFQIKDGPRDNTGDL